MALTITDQVMRSTDTPHNACRLPTEASPDADIWAVSWLPKRRLTRNQAISAMSIAEEVGQIPAHADPEAYSETFWVNVDGWAAELGLAGPDAVARVSEPPGAAS
jgi:hypothetical protein